MKRLLVGRSLWRTVVFMAFGLSLAHAPASAANRPASVFEAVDTSSLMISPNSMQVKPSP